MNMWTPQESQRIAVADDLHIAPYRDDGKTLGTPTWIWSVMLDGALYVRAYNGRNSIWYNAAVRQKAGQISVAGMTRDVEFESVKGTVDDRIDGAYRDKYRSSPYLPSMIGPQARSATIKITLR